MAKEKKTKEIFKKEIVPDLTFEQLIEKLGIFIRPDIRDAVISGGILRDSEIRIVDSAGKNLFTVLQSGPDQGDIIIGDYDNDKGIKYDASAGTITYKGVSVEWADVADGASTKPEDNATEGAKAGTDLTDSGDNILEDEDIIKLMQTLYGNAADGDVVISSNANLTSNMYYDDLTVNATKVLSPSGYEIFCQGTLTINGIISRVGNDGEDATSSTSGDGGAAIGGGYLGGSGAGGDGGSPAGENGYDGANVTSSLGANGGAGQGVGGAGGTASAPPASSGEFKAYPLATLLYDSIVGSRIYGGAGGGGGTGYSNNGAGGGGSGGGVILICAKEIVIGATGIITTQGGSGGEGENPPTGYGGGGGGGADIILIYNKLTNGGSITANGGAAGTGATAGSNATIVYLQV